MADPTGPGTDPSRARGDKPKRAIVLSLRVSLADSTISSADQRLGLLHGGEVPADREALEALARISHPRVVVDTAGLSPKATELANRLAEEIGELDEETLERLLATLNST